MNLYNVKPAFEITLCPYNNMTAAGCIPAAAIIYSIKILFYFSTRHLTFFHLQCIQGAFLDHELCF
jgi:hypothetical protein